MHIKNESAADNHNIPNDSTELWRNVNFNVIEVIDLSQPSEVKSDLRPDLKTNLMVGTSTGKNVMLYS